MPRAKVFETIQKLPEGYWEGSYKSKKYGITKETFAGGKSFKVFGKELGGSDFISFNYYRTSNKDFLKPCEMPVEKVLAFLKNVELENR